MRVHPEAAGDGWGAGDCEWVGCGENKRYKFGVKSRCDTRRGKTSNQTSWLRSSITPSVKVSESPKTAFSVEKLKDSHKSSSSYDPGYHSSSTTSNSEEPDEILCNIALKLKNSPAMSINASK
ncbi:hypothetical protein Hanom_Chr04g00283751 [Helianthus anomalus]